MRRSDAEAPILWLPDAKRWLTGKDPDAGRERRQKEKATDELAGWHHRLNRHELGQTPGVGAGQGSLQCCSPCGCEELDTIWLLNNNKNNVTIFIVYFVFIPLGITSVFAMKGVNENMVCYQEKLSLRMVEEGAKTISFSSGSCISHSHAHY